MCAIGPNAVGFVPGSETLLITRGVSKTPSLSQKPTAIRWIGADEQKVALSGNFEAWGRAEENPIGGRCRLKKGLQCRS